jgi:hypothetical protein
MKHLVSIASCALLVCWAVPALSAGPAVAAEPLTTGGPVGSVSQAPETEGYCYAEADCLNGTVSCTGSDTCTYRDRDCPTTRGWVRCDGVTTYCWDVCIIQCPKAWESCTTDTQCQVLGDPECVACFCNHGICMCPE